VETVDLKDYNAAWDDSVVVDVVAAVLTELQSDNIRIQPGQTNFNIITPTGKKNNYIALVTTQGSFTVYVTDYVNVALMKQDGTVILPADKTIEAATAYECPLLRTRLVFDGVGETVLMRVTETDNTKAETFSLAVL